jgi:hypothetical protein
MDVFFTFIDKINKPIFVLYDKNFIHINKYLLSSLGFISTNRPGSLTQIMESKWKNRLIALKPDEEIDIPLIMNGGKIQNYRVRMHQLEIEKSEYICFILTVKEAVDQILDMANRIFSKLPFPAFTFNNDFEFIQMNEAMKNLEKINVSSFDDLKKLFLFDGNPDISNNEISRFRSVDSKMEMFLFKPLPGLSDNYFTGIITQSSQNEKGIDIEFVKNSISQSIQRLVQVQKIYGNQSKIEQSIWEGFHNEITSLSQIRRHLEYESSLVNLDIDDLLNLNKVIVNELEILKSNDFFRQNIKLITQFADNLKPLNKNYTDITGYLVPLIDQIAEFTCQSENNELYIETMEEEDLIWLKIYMKISSQSAKQKSKNFKDIIKYENQFKDADVMFICNMDSKKNIDLSIGFEK